MTSLSAEVANWSSIQTYEFGDTVRWLGQVYILNALSNTVPPYVPGVPPYTGDSIWFNPATGGVPTPPSPSPITNLTQTGATWDAQLGKGTISVSWSGGFPNSGFTFSSNGISANLPAFVDEDTQTATLFNLGSAPGFTTDVFIAATPLIGSPVYSSPGVPMATLGPPPAATISLVAFSIDPVTGKGSVAITFATNSGVSNDAESYRGFAIGSTGRDGQPNYKFEYNRSNGTATFSEITSIFGATPPNSFKVFIQGFNSVGEGPISNILLENFNPQPPLPDNATNIALVTFLVGGSDYTTGWSLNTSGNTAIGSWDCHTGAFAAGTTNPIPLFQQLQSRGVRVMLSLGGATWNVAAGLSNGTNLARNIAYSFFGVGSSPSGWARYGGASPFNFDGLDLDWETLGPTDRTQPLNFVTIFRSLLPNALLACAPQPTYSNDASAPFHPSVFNANGGYSAFPSATSPVSAYNPRTSGQAALLDADYIGFFDYVFVQYYNQDPAWLPGGGAFVENVGQWSKMCVAGLPQTRDTARLVLGFGATDTTPSTPPNRYDGSQNGEISRALTFTQNSLNTPDTAYFCAGCGFWNSPTANVPPPPESNPFTQIYNATSGVANLPADIIMMYLNASGVNPQWTNLPILDFEEPGFPYQRPVIYTAAAAVIAPLHINGISITLDPTVKIDGNFVALQVDVATATGAGAPETADNYGSVALIPPATGADQRVYWLVEGVTDSGARPDGSPAPATFYNLNVRAIYQDGTTPNSFRQVTGLNANKGLVQGNASFFPTVTFEGGLVRTRIPWQATSSPKISVGLFADAAYVAKVFWRDAGSTGNFTALNTPTTIFSSEGAPLPNQTNGQPFWVVSFSPPIAGAFQYYVAFTFLYAGGANIYFSTATNTLSFSP